MAFLCPFFHDFQNLKLNWVLFVQPEPVDADFKNKTSEHTDSIQVRVKMRFFSSFSLNELSERGPGGDGKRGQAKLTH